MTITFNKSISTSERILSKRGAETGFAQEITDPRYFLCKATETSFSLLAIDTDLPGIDTRPNLAVGLETRHDQAPSLFGDDPIGNISATLTVIVPS